MTIFKGFILEFVHNQSNITLYEKRLKNVDLKITMCTKVYLFSLYVLNKVVLVNHRNNSFSKSDVSQKGRHGCTAPAGGDPTMCQPLTVITITLIQLSGALLLL